MSDVLNDDAVYDMPITFRAAGSLLCSVGNATDTRGGAVGVRFLAVVECSACRALIRDADDVDNRAAHAWHAHGASRRP